MTLSRLTIASLRRGTLSPSLYADSAISGLHKATRTSAQQRLGSTLAQPVSIPPNGAKYAATRNTRQSRHASSALTRKHPTPKWHYVIPAVVTQGGLALFGPGIHLEARDLPIHHQHVKSAHHIPYVKTEIVKLAENPSFWRRLRQQLEDLWEDYVVHPVLTIWRFGVLALIFLPLIITVPAVFLGERNKELSDERSGTLWWYSLLVKHMELAGPTFIKLSQWAASRTDIFPTQLCIMLSKLHNQVDPHSIEHTRRTIEAAFGGRKLEDLFDEFIETPLGIGAIAQVYRGRLKPGIALHFEPEEETEKNGDGVIQKLSSVTKSQDSSKPKKLKTEVAIKVLHPKVARTVERDLAIMMFFANIINHIPNMRWIALPDQVAMFSEMMQEQLDLRIEAKNLEKFQRNFRTRYTVTFPTALKQFATREMLIEEFVDALPLKTILQKGAGPFDLKIADIGLDGFLRMLIFDNFVHADLHPGNIFVRFYNPSANNLFKQILSRLKGEEHSTISSTDEATMRLRAVPEGDNEAWMRELECLYNEGFRPQVVFIDAGLVSELSDKNRRDFLDLFHALAEFDGYRAGKLMMERCRSPESVIDGEVFALRMQKLIIGVKETAMSLGKIKIADLLSEVMAMVRTHHVPMEGDFANVVISILILEGIGRQLNPNIDLFKTALPILRQLGRQDGGRGVVEGVKELPGGGGWWIKMWFLLEARQWAHETLESTTTVDRHLDVLLHPAI
ncbi:MAG: putative ubiquinone biosynthesis protein [Linnemannia gamsii]|nr:MAG: putative ubiquinone biosynthesis protein [Linnemannia gamsii]